MAGAARVGDTITGMTTGTHHYHYEDNCWEEPVWNEDGTHSGYTTVCGDPILVYDPAVPITGTITTGSSNVYIDGRKAAFVGSTTSESDAYDSGTGVVSGGSTKVYINGNRAARNGDTVTPHSGTASINSGSSQVFIN